ncbi:hypothetical protein [Pseudomonas coleopterorum]|uniref:GT-D fold domain-containing protein n=1 Tax=Pseudomonas coleopterorum TaxID=1605838 RepID=UPI00089BB13A|nr:hypothetical protein [Pseudomonas coleopterorum]SEE35096.1 hypothetical protein SAMN05216510_2285 [Pseudomonas coleopterorum]
MDNTLSSIEEYNALLVQGVQWRNDGNFELAEKALVLACKSMPLEWQGYYELALIYEIRKDSLNLRQCLEHALTRNPGQIDTIHKLLTLVILDDNDKDYFKFISIIDFSHELIIERVCALDELRRFRKLHPIASIQEGHQQIVEQSEGWIFVEDVIQRMREALHNREGFAFIRLGDGEGTWLNHDKADEILYHTMRSINRTEFWNIWYGEEVAVHRYSFLSIMHNLAFRLGEADILGIPPLTWLEHEHAIGSLRGLPGTVNVVKLLAANSAILENMSLCTQLMHYELSNHPDFLEFLCNLDRIAIISCHPETAQLMQLKFGILDVLYIPVPGEPSRAHLLGENSVKGQHYPDGFYQTLQSINTVDFTGLVCLVGGGILGKLYSLEIKARGGIAIDVGSVMDKWLNKPTRPDFF